MINLGGEPPTRIISSAREVERVYADGGKLMWNKYGYSNNGLLVWYDGINNTGGGHDDVDYWHDLSGNGYTAYLKKSVPDGGWGNNGYVFKGRNEYFVIDSLSMLQLNPKQNQISIEIVTVRGDQPLCEYNTVLTAFDDRISLYRSGYNTNLTWKGPSNRPKQDSYRSGSIAATFDLDGMAMLYTDDMNTPIGLRSFWGETLTSSAITIGGSDSSHYYTGTIYAIRIYKRLLSKQEILMHHAIDVKRFGLTE